MTRNSRRVVLHVGLPKTGTTYLQSVLAARRDVLRDRGVLYPAIRPGAHFRGAVEVRGSHQKFGLSAADVAGSWQALVDAAVAYDGSTLISHEVLAGASREEIARAVAPLAGCEVHVVIGARDLARQAVAHWQEEVKLGDSRSFADFEHDQFDADTSRDDPDRPHFWHAQDFAGALARWSSAVPPQRVHLVVAPRAGAPTGELWVRFAQACGLPQIAVPEQGSTNAGLGVTEIALLRELNQRVSDRLTRADYLRVIKRHLAEGILADGAQAPAHAPAPLVERLSTLTHGWLDEVRSGGYPVHGDLDDLIPAPVRADQPHPDAVAPETLSGRAIDVLARVLEEVEDSRTRA